MILWVVTGVLEDSGEALEIQATFTGVPAWKGEKPIFIMRGECLRCKPRREAQVIGGNRNVQNAASYPERGITPLNLWIHSYHIRTAPRLSRVGT